MRVAIGLAALLAVPSAAQAASELYASDWTQGAISSFAVGPGGLLSQQGTGLTSSGSQPAGVAIAPNGQEVFVADKNQGTISTFAIGAGGTLTQVGPPVLSGNSNSTTNSEPFGVAVSPNGENLYTANYVSGTVSTFSIGAGGVLTQQGTGITSGSKGPSWVAVSPNGQNLYVTDYDAGTVSTFAIGAGGALTPQSIPVSTGSGNGSEPENLSISPNGQDLYVANHADGTVTTFAIGAGGGLTAQGASIPSGTGVGSGPQGIAISPNGDNLYVTNENEGTVSGFAIGGGGALTAQGSTGPISGTTTSSQPFGAAVSPNGQDLYVANFALGSVSTYSIGPGGALTAQGPPAISGVNSSSGAYELAVSPDQGPVAAYAAMLSPTTATGTFSAQPSVAGSTPIGTYAWQFGDGTRASGPLVTHTFPARGTYAVTLTLTGTDSCSVSGPFTGQSAMCTSDPPATFTHAITMPAPPVASREAISGVAKGKPKLAFTVAAGTLAPSLATITVNLPTGLTWSTRKTNLARHIAVTGANGKAAKFTATVHRRALTLALASVQPSARVTITNPELWASKSLVKQVDPPRKSGKRGKKVKRPKPVRLTFKLKLTDAAHDAINLVLKATAA